jgi:hypothetical protein
MDGREQHRKRLSFLGLSRRRRRRRTEALLLQVTLKTPKYAFSNHFFNRLSYISKRVFAAFTSSIDICVYCWQAMKKLQFIS